jgi:small-conductance mechanosensitive channel
MIGYESPPFGAWIESPWVHGPVFFLLWLAVFLSGKKILFGIMRRVAGRAGWGWNEVLIGALASPLRLAIVASGLLVLERSLPLSEKWDRALDVALAAAVALAIVLFIDRACAGILDRLAPRSPDLAGARGLIQGTVRGLAIGLGLLIFLDSIGISITPILASLGVGSLAVALALQDTLANLFAGLYMVADKPIEAGQFIRLESGDQGYVTRLGWRSTWIRTPGDFVIVVPNSKLAGSLITNYDLPAREFSTSVDLGVAYDSDLERVEQTALEIAREVMRSVPGGVPGFEPSVRFNAFADFSIRVSVGIRVRDFASSQLVRHEVMKRLVARFRADGIVIPFPVRTLDIPQDVLTGLRDGRGGAPRAGDPAGAGAAGGGPVGFRPQGG